MPTLVAFLRGLNVGGHTVKMDRLRALFEELGVSDVKTLIASGNVVFTSRAKSVEALAKRIASHLQASLGYPVATLLRTNEEVAAIAEYQPFPKPRVATAKVLSVGFFPAPLGAAGTKLAIAYRTATDDFHVRGRELYWLCQTGTSDSAFPSAKLEKQLGMQATFRNMNTIRRLAALVDR
ncbi:MAG: DUF1697 domain-containing protein [Gemmatimonadales bacterium]|nr:DUF1697 domain-containing protein [Gemmatimonadales bacterium]